MICERIILDNGVRGIVCHGRGKRRRPKCSVEGCRSLSAFQCDHERPGGGTCDAHLCEAHATGFGPDRHACPRHVTAMTQGRLEF